MSTSQYKQRKVRALQISQCINELFAHKEGTALNYNSPWELLVAVILSAQSRDTKVNEITSTLFLTFPTIESIAKSTYEEFDALISTINYHITKGKNIVESARKIMSKHKGIVPESIEALMELPGVGRKTANVIVANAFGDIQGIAVDTHVRRLSIKMNLTDNTDPSKIEKDLCDLLPKELWFTFHNNLIYYGREICPARVHDCSKHPLTVLFPEAENRWPKASGILE